MSTSVLALDLASVSGWACGEPGGRPAHGSHRFASAGASHEAIFCNALHWAHQMCRQFAPGLIVWEAPIPTSFNRGHTTSDVTTILYGLPAVIGAAAYELGIYDIRKADTRDVRNHFIGSNPKRAKAKPLVIRQCRAMGWDVADGVAARASTLGCVGAVAGCGLRPGTLTRTTGALWPFAPTRILRGTPMVVKRLARG
jgi:hypothetical protein